MSQLKLKDRCKLLLRAEVKQKQKNDMGFSAVIITCITDQSENLVITGVLLTGKVKFKCEI